jgi:hypothetical protein
MHATYYGANVRIVSFGAGLDGGLKVQRYNPLANDWMDDREFYEHDDYCHTNARQHASRLAAFLHKGE